MQCSFSKYISQSLTIFIEMFQGDEYFSFGGVVKTSDDDKHQKSDVFIKKT